MNDEFGRQADALVRENQHLRVKSDNDDITMQLMREQYKALADSVEDMRSGLETKLHRMRVERDEAVLKHRTIKGLLLQSTDLVMQALRADKGDETPEIMPPQTGRHIEDDRLPLAELN